MQNIYNTFFCFSYSVMNNISGIEYPATAFVGCDNGVVSNFKKSINNNNKNIFVVWSEF